MSESPKLFIAGIGMVTPLGANTEMTAAAVKAGMSAYQISENYTQDTRQPILMTRVPDEHLGNVEAEIDEGNHYSLQADRIIKMAILAIREAIGSTQTSCAIPIILSMPEDDSGKSYIEPELLVKNLVNQPDLKISKEDVHVIQRGRASAIMALDMALNYLTDEKLPYVLLGGSDSHWSTSRLSELEEKDRLLTPTAMDGFVTGEGAGFLLLTSQSDKAKYSDDSVIGISRIGIADEPGALGSELAHLGEGLDKSFKQVLNEYTEGDINFIYSSMNGENFWAKEYGIASMRNQHAFAENVELIHPADSYGDIGAATGSVLIGLACSDLIRRPESTPSMVYSSSDGKSRAAVLVEKQPRVIL